jgi:tetratricopeptide (TPR) repeat protein
VDHRTDVYALGVTLYELLVLRPAVDGKDRGEILQRIAAEEPAPPRRLDRAIPADLETVVLKAMAKDPAERYATAQELADDLRRVLEDKPIRAKRPSTFQRARKWSRRHKPVVWSAAVVCALAVLGGGGGLIWVQQDRAARALAQAHHEAEIDRDAAAALQEATLFQGKGEYPQALAGARKAEGLLAGGGSAALRQRTRELLADLEILSRVEEIRRDQAQWMVRAPGGSDIDIARAAPLYAAAFRRYGIDVQALEPAEAADRIVQRAIRAELLAALVDWSWLTPDKEERERLFKIIQAADPEPKGLFRQWCQIGLQADKAALLRWAAADETEELPPAPLAISGLWLLDAGCPAEAVSLLHRAQRRHPDDFWVNLFLAIALLEKSPQADEAVRFASAALAVRPRSARAFFTLGTALTAQNKLPEAVAACRRALELEPNYFQAHYHLGKALWLQGKDAEAAAAFGTALQLQPDDPQAHAGLGLVLFAQHKFPEAAKEFEQAIKRQDKYAKAYVFLGNALREQGKVMEAIEQFRMAEKLDPKLADAPFNLGLALERDGKTAAAADAFRQAIALQEDHAGAHHNLGTALRNLGKLDEAVAEYRQAIKLMPDNAETHCNLGHVLFLQGRLDEAAEHYSRAIALQPDYPDAEAGLGSVLAAQDQLDKAANHFRKAIKSKPDALTYYNLAQVLEQQGEFDKALKTMKQAQDQLPPDDPQRLRPAVAQRLRQCERLIDLDRKLPDVLKGERKPANALERIVFAQVCVRKRLFGAAASLYEEAFADEPRLAEDGRSDLRYEAARAAAAAGCGRGKEKPALSEEARAQRRQQALEWLRADLALANRQLKGATPQARLALRQRFQKWQRDPFLAGLRDEPALTELPKAERQACLELWTEVEVFLVRARGPG